MCRNRRRNNSLVLLGRWCQVLLRWCHIMMYSDPVSPGQMGQDTAASGENVSKSVKDPETTKEFDSLFRTILASCGGFVETAALFLSPSDCVSCFNESRSPRSPRSTRRNSKLKQAQKLKENPSREGEVVDVPIKLVKSRSGKAVTNDEGEVYDPYRSFDDNISAISAHTLDEMARKEVGPIISSHRSGRKGNHRPRNGDELLPPSPARLSSSESSDDSAARDNPHDEIENGKKRYWIYTKGIRETSRCSFGADTKGARPKGIETKNEPTGIPTTSCGDLDEKGGNDECNVMICAC